MRARAQALSVDFILDAVGVPLEQIVPKEADAQRSERSREIDRAYPNSLERGLENPTVAVFEKPGQGLSIPIANLSGAVAGRGWAPPFDIAWVV